MTPAGPYTVPGWVSPCAEAAVAASAAVVCVATAPMEAVMVSAIPPREKRAKRDRRGFWVVLDRIAPWFFHSRLPG
ncbi:hypothetical protein GCM10007964_33250 [Sphaerisporangium melleum]|uniref:Uncharacterized protein n=1 Tax=Sphaerisporangium melleum TaxID=321316 RepID=A0A917VJQ2_9ACTN|nr:hypothetical protein GCM10007964_33250 [Sphaerisporangium melleum]